MPAYVLLSRAKVQAIMKRVGQGRRLPRRNPPPAYVHLTYMGDTLWRTIPYQVQMGDRVVTRGLRVKLQEGAVVKALPGDMNLSQIPIRTRGKGYYWLVPRRDLEVTRWPEPVTTRIERSREKYLQNPGEVTNPIGRCVICSQYRDLNHLSVCKRCAKMYRSKRNPLITWGSPYTHEEHSRESKTRMPHESCDWCGQKPKTLFKYDGRRGWFCNKECYQSYHG